MRRLPLVIAAIVLACDQFSKWLVVRYLAPDNVATPIPGLLNIVFSRNNGIAFGILNGSDWRGQSLFLTALTGLITAGVAVALWRMSSSKLWLRVALGLILGGALGNLIDRVRTDSVVDFIDAHIGQHHWHTFNLADSAIVAGAILLVIDILFSKSPDAFPTEESPTQRNRGSRGQ